jgi:hypothetical protein
VFIRRPEREALHRRGKFGGFQNSNRAAAIQGEIGGVVSKYNSPHDALAASHAPRHNFLIRFLLGVLVGAALFLSRTTSI